MKNAKSDLPEDNLRKNAEELLYFKPLGLGSPISEILSSKLVHELEVYQVELEMQKEELLQAWAKAETSSDKFNEFFDFAPIGYYTLSKEGQIIDLNLLGAKMLGKECWRLKSSNFGFFVSDDTKPIFNSFLERVFATKTSLTCDITLSINDKVPVYVHLTGVITKNGQQCFLMVDDITNQKFTEERLLAEQVFRNAVEASISSRITIVDTEGRQTYVSPSFCSLVGWSEEELIGQTAPYVYWPPEQLKAIDEAFRTTLANNAPKEGFELVFSRKDGVLIPVQVLISPFNKGADTIGWLANVIDITDRKRAEEILRVSEQRWQFAIEGTGDGIWDWNAQNNQVFFSHRWKEMLGYSDDEIGTTLDEWIKRIHPDDAKQCFADLNKYFEKETPYYQNEHRVLCKDGTYKWILDRGKVMEWHIDGKPLRVIGTHTDITERKRYEAEIKLKNEQLNKAIAEKDKFFSIIAHDLRSPFQPFLGLTRMLVEDLPTLRLDEIQKMALNMRNSASKLFNLLENLLEWSRMQRGITSFVPGSFFILPKISESLVLILDAITHKEIDFTYEVPDDLTVFADSNMFESLIRNLVSNATKFTTPKGKITITAKPMDDNWVEISIKDTGVGMNKEMLENLFKLDTNTNRKGTEGELSTGLGLIICKDFVEKHGGKLWVESEVNRGSTFYFTLPNKARK